VFVPVVQRKEGAVRASGLEDSQDGLSQRARLFEGEVIREGNRDSVERGETLLEAIGEARVHGFGVPPLNSEFRF
jgi:hypothetical protein